MKSIKFVSLHHLNCIKSAEPIFSYCILMFCKHRNEWPDTFQFKKS